MRSASVILENAAPIAFRVSTAVAALERGEKVEFEGVKLILDGGGLHAVGSGNTDLGSHQSFWFA